MATCNSCGFKAKGPCFKGKICPVCNTSEVDGVDSIVDKSPVIEPVEKIDHIQIETSAEELPYEIPTEPSPEEQLAENIENQTLDAIMFTEEEWQAVTGILYNTLHNVIAPFNPEFYESPAAQQLLQLNSMISARILSGKGVNPLLAQVFVMGIYCMPALAGFITGKHKTEDQESVIKDADKENEEALKKVKGDAT